MQDGRFIKVTLDIMYFRVISVMKKKLMGLLKVTETDCTSEYVQRSQKKHRFILFGAFKVSLRERYILQYSGITPASVVRATSRSAPGAICGARIEAQHARQLYYSVSIFLNCGVF